MQAVVWLSLPFIVPSVPTVQATGEPALAATKEVVGSAFRFGDFDGDGLEDVYVVDPRATDRLFKNTGNGVFEDVTALHGLQGIHGSRMALWFDFDGDQALDLYVSSAIGGSRLLQNTGAGMFVDVTEVSGVKHAGGELFAEALDIDADARQDLHVVTARGDVLFQNLGRGSFERVDLPLLAPGAEVVSEVPFADGAASSSAVEGDRADVNGDGRERAIDRERELLRRRAGALAGAGGGSLGEGEESSANSGPLLIGNRCPKQIKDDATGNCLSASTTPTLGMLHPLSISFNVGATGSVGIGTTAPEGRVHVLDGVAGTVTADSNSSLVLEDSTRCYMSLLTPDGEERGILFGEPSNNAAGAIMYDNITTPDGLQLRTNGNVTRMAISSTGNVGIGTTNPGHKLDIVDTAQTPVAVKSTHTGGTWLDLSNQSTGGDSWSLVSTGSTNSEGAGRLLLRDNDTNTVAMTVQPDGRVGLGVTAPEGTLHVHTSSAGSVTASGNTVLTCERNGNGYVSILTPDANERGVLFGEPSNSAAGGILYNSPAVQDGLDLRTNGNNTRVAITGTGAVGVGTTSPRELVEIRTPDATLRLQNSNDSSGNLGAFAGDTFSTLQLGMVNSTAAPIGAIPANTKRSMLGMDTNGKVGSMTNVFGAPVFRNLLDDGNGNAYFVASYGTIKISGGGGDALEINPGATAFSGLNVLGTNTTAGQVLGQNFATTGTSSGVIGRSDAAAGYGVFSVGAFGGTGAKYFVQPHPTDASKEIRFICLEGNEAGTYFRGKTQLARGHATIAVPEDFRLVTESEGLTVQLTAVGRGDVWIESYDLFQVRIAGESDVEVHYTVNGVRRGYADMPTMRDNVAYIPKVRGVPYGTQYPKALRDVLVANGTLNENYTPNETTAAKFGWQLVEPYTQAAHAYGWGPERRPSSVTGPATTSSANR